jgi:hypothetical protein
MVGLVHLRARPHRNNDHRLTPLVELAEVWSAGLVRGIPMNGQKGARDSLHGKTAQLALLGAAIIVLLFFAYTYVR